jgi:predicted transcriptional regulator
MPSLEDARSPSPDRIEPPVLRPEIFDATMRSLEAGLTIADVATFELESCRIGNEVRDVLNDARFALFDAIPVREDDRVVGVLERRRSPGPETVESAMRRLDDSLLVSAHDPLKSLVRLLSTTPYRLVVDDARILGIVTRSDVHKLPMRLLVFALVTHLELLMAEIITTRLPDDAWIDKLSGARRENFEKKRTELRSANFDPPLIELTDFCDKRDLALPLLVGQIGMGRRKAQSELGRIEDLRNKVAHAAGFATNRREFARLWTRSKTRRPGYVG